MRNTKIQAVLTILVCIILCNCNNTSQRDLHPKDKELIGKLELLPAEKTGIDFENTITESVKFNHFYYSQIYVGSGVAIGDINNDGLDDIFFGGNQVKDRLYLNKGDLKFEDITKSSRVGVNSGWTWGVTMADVNADGFLDIYVSRTGNTLNENARRNKLYINNKNSTFTESAATYGLADKGFSTQSVFFDMDNDGDLDMYQVNQLPDKKLMLIETLPKAQFKYLRDKLYRNDNGKFVDVSNSTGISRDVSYGLSVSASDFNNDGFVDLYVANDYAEPDFMYYNNGNGTFKNVINEKLNHITQLSMGTDTGDINNDGLLDLITTDMTPEDHYRSKTNMASMSTDAFNAMVNSGAHHQYMCNALQVNTGMGTFSDVAYMAGVSNTDWSWASLLVDLDNDGLKDIIISNGIKKDVDNNDYRNKLKQLDKGTTEQELFELSKGTPSQPISNYAFKNNGNFNFKKVTKDWGFDAPSFSNGMAYSDLDNDGDLDVVTNNIDSPAFVYENKATGNYLKINLKGTAKNKFALGAKAKITYADNIQFAEHTVTRGFLSSVGYGLFFGLGKETKVDKVEVFWADGKVNVFENVDANTNITADYKDAKLLPKINSKTPLLVNTVKSERIGIDYMHTENEYDDFREEVLLPHRLSQNGPFSAKGDVNNDGLEDVFIGSASGSSAVLYLQNQKGNFIRSNSQPWEVDKASEDMGCLFFDADTDGDLDLYVTSGSNEFKVGNTLLKDRLYINDGNGTFSKSANALPNIYKSTECVKASDIDGDGDLDLFVGTRVISGKYTYAEASHILINQNGKFTDAQNDTVETLNTLGMVSDAVFSDIDKDGDEDLIIVGEWMGIKILHNTKGVFKDNTEDYNLGNTTGIWWSITAEDLNNDGTDDYILGNLGKNNKFKASKEHPFKVYANDFDNNGTNDVVLAKYYKNDYVPLRGRECTSQQMPYVSEKFEDYHSFASSTLIDILPEDKVKDAVIHEIESFASIILINKNGQLEKQVLPNQAQMAPIKSSLVYDVNNDGHKDILLVGNHYGVEVETTRYDAGFGALLLGDGSANFKYVSPTKSGFYVPMDSRDIKSIKQKKHNLILVTNNNSKPTVFEIKR